jgi:hypothetical protein
MSCFQSHSISLLEVSLETTRRDQLQAQFAFLNHSICGDYKYGPLALMEEELKGKSDIDGDSSAAVTNTASPDNGVEGVVGLSVEGRDSSSDSDSETSSKRDNNRDSASDSAGVGVGVRASGSDPTARHDPIRRLGVHFSEVRLTHPLSKAPLTITSSCPASFNDVIRRFLSTASSTSFADGLPAETSRVGYGSGTRTENSMKSRGNEDEEGEEKEEEEVEEDGQLDSLQAGSRKHTAESSINDKVKVFTLTEFLGSSPSSSSKSPRNDPKKKQDRNKEPPQSAQFTFGKKKK